MATYCMSDMHGEYDKYIEMLNLIEFSDEDTLYVLGDVVDRGPNPMAILQDMMMRSNVIPLIGNHEYMAIQCLDKLSQEITAESIDKMDSDFIEGLLEWLNVGGQSTIDDFSRLSKEEKGDILDYMGEFEAYEETICNGKSFVMVHAGIDNFDPDKLPSDLFLDELIFHSPDYSKVYYHDKYLITGHLPTWLIAENDRPGEIYRNNNHIAIDCGCAVGGKLAAICLETGKEYYV